MKITELINNLAQLLKEHGDVEVLHYQEGYAETQIDEITVLHDYVKDEWAENSVEETVVVIH